MIFSTDLPRRAKLSAPPNASINISEKNRSKTSQSTFSSNRKKEETTGAKQVKGLENTMLGGRLEVALLQTALHAQGHVCGNQVAKFLDIFPFKGEIVPYRRPDDILLQPEKGLRFLLDARVLAGETGDESGGSAVRIELGVQRAEREYGHLHGLEGVWHRAGSVLQYELWHQAALDDQVELRTSRVRMGRIKSTGAYKANRCGGVGADQGREWHPVCADGFSALAIFRWWWFSRGIREVEFVVGVLRQDRDTIDGFGGK